MSDQVNQPAQYIVVSSQFETQGFADALVKAEMFNRTSPQKSWGIYKLDTTVEQINGVIVVRPAE